MGFSGRCEAIKAPTTENDTVQVGRSAIEGPSQARKISPRVRPLRRARIRLAAASTTHSRHSDQAIQAANRMLILPSPRPRFLAPSVTTPPLYRTPVSQGLRLLLRGGVLSELRRIHLLRTPVSRSLTCTGCWCAYRQASGR